MEHHFVVKYDTRTARFLVDDDTAAAVLPDGPIYDPEDGGWRLAEAEDDHDELALLLTMLLASG